MTRKLGRWALLVAASLVCACGGGSGGSGGGSNDGDADFLGSCTGAPDHVGVYSCVERWEEDDERSTGLIAWRSTCTGSAATYAEGHCSGGYVGCCVRTQTEPGPAGERRCYYGDGDWSLAESACAGLGGTWE